MITPRFSLTQDEEFVVVEIELKYVKIQHAEFSIQGESFSFYLKPYLLHLQLPGEVLDAEDNE